MTEKNSKSEEKKNIFQKILDVIFPSVSTISEDEDIEGKTFTFMQKVVCPWAKQTMRIDGKYIYVEKTNVMFGLIPSGKEERKLNRYLIQTTSLNTDMNGMELVISLVISGAIVSTIKRYGVTLETVLLCGICFVFGLLMFFDSFKTRLDIGKSGSLFSISVPYFERAKLKALYPKLQLKNTKNRKNSCRNKNKNANKR